MSNISSVGSSMNSSMLKQVQEEMFKRGDANGDSSISKDEFNAVSKSGKNPGSTDSEAMFAQLDTDSDGAISRLESDAAIAKAGQAMQSQGMRPQGQPPGPPPGQPPAGDSESSSSESTDISAIFDEMDTNQDGVVSLAEMTAAFDSSDNELNQDTSAQDTVAQTLQSMLDAIEESSASNEDSSSSATLKSILTSALNSYMQQSSISYAQSTVSGSSISTSA